MIALTLITISFYSYADPRIEQGGGVAGVHMPVSITNADNELKFNDSECTESLLDNGNGVISDASALCTRLVNALPWAGNFEGDPATVLIDSNSGLATNCAIVTSNYNGAQGVAYTAYASPVWSILHKAIPLGAKATMYGKYRLISHLVCIDGAQ